MPKPLKHVSPVSRAHLSIFILIFVAIGGVAIWRSLAASNPNLPGDLNNDNTVNVTDLSILLSNYGTSNSTADINSDGTVNILDLSALLSHYGQNYSPPVSGVAPPAPPSAYALPSGATVVSTVSGLASALSGSTRDIILENGTYANTGSLLIGSHRLWARNLGGATLQFGLQIGGNGSTSGGEIHGLKLDISNASTTADSAAIQIWGNTAGQNAGVYDSWIYGHGVLTFGIEDRVTSGFKAQRIVMSDFTSYGVFFETYYPNYYTDSPAVEPVVSDINVSNVSRVPAGSSNGTAEAGIWAGTDCLCSNIKIRNAGWMGLWLGGNANNGTYSNFDIDNIGSYGAGVYLEHYSRSNVFKNFVIGQSSNGAGIKVGFNCEWADPAYIGTNPMAGQSIAGCHFNTIQDGAIYSSYRGIQLEDAEKTTIQRIKFIGQSDAALDDFMTAGSGQTTIWQNQGNDFSGIKPGALQYSTAH